MLFEHTVNYSEMFESVFLYNIPAPAATEITVKYKINKQYE